MPWLLLAILGFVIHSVYYNYLIIHYDSIDDKKKVRNSAFIQMLLGVALAIVSFFYSYSNDKQTENIETLGKLDTALGSKNEILARSIQSLSDLNNKLTSKNIFISDTIKGLNDTIHELSVDIRKLTRANLQLAESAREENLLSGQLDFHLKKPLKDSDNIGVDFGTMVFEYTAYFFKGEHPPKLIGSSGDSTYNPLRLIIDKGKMYFSYTAYDLEGNWIVDISNNYWRRNPNTTGKFNYDSAGFEIVDNRGFVVLSIILLNNNLIRIRGYLFERDYGYIYVAGNGLTRFNLNIRNWYPVFLKLYKDNKIKSIFEYNSPDYLHKRLPIKPT